MSLKRICSTPALVLALAIAAGPVSAQLTLPAPDGSAITIRRDEFGVPHILAETEEAAFFAQGFVSGVDRLFQLEQFRRVAEGRVSEIPLLAGLLLDSDREVLRDFYTPAERRRQFEELDDRFKRMLESYMAGVNRFLDSMEINPGRYRPAEVDLLASFGIAIEPWTVTNTIAIAQFMLRQFGQAGGTELVRQAELQEHGRAWFDEHRPINDPDAPTTIPPGETVTSDAALRRFEAPGWEAGRRLPAREAAQNLPRVDPSLARSVRDQENAVRRARGALGIPSTFGSFAVLVSPDRSETNGSLLLGAPQMLTPDPTTTSIVYEIELQSPTLHIAGISLAGIPGVLIGRSPNHAWTLTSGISDNTDVFIETTEDTTFGRYRHDGEWLDFEVFVDTLGAEPQTVEYRHYRTTHGPVFAEDLTSRQVFAKQMTFWDRELEAFEAFDRFWRATSVQEFEEGAARMPLSFNLFYADVEGTIGFWHIGRYREPSDSLDPRLPRRGDGTQEWTGFISFEDQPQIINPAQAYLVNWNNKPSVNWDHGDNIPWAFANELDDRGGVDRVIFLDKIVGSRTVMSFEDLTKIPLELTSTCRNGDFDYPCNTRGTYEQMLSMSPTGQEAVNILPPGQTASPFLPGFGEAGPHANDQWGMFAGHEYKPMPFGSLPSVGIQDERVPEASLRLLGSYPNPFRENATIRFELPRSQKVTVSIVDLLGRRIGSVKDKWLGSGIHEVDLELAHLGAGVYFCRLTSGGQTVTRKLVVAD